MASCNAMTSRSARAGHNAYKSDVSTVCCIPAREEIFFSAVCNNRIPTRKVGHVTGIGSAKESEPASHMPRCHSTNPLSNERDALPLPKRANCDRCIEDKFH